MQQISRSGRDGREPYTVILRRKLKTNEHMTSYVENKRLCRRDQIFRDCENRTHASINKSCRCCDFCIRNVPVVDA